MADKTLPPDPDDVEAQRAALRARNAAYQRVYKERNYEHVLENRRRWKEQNRERLIQQRREYRAQPGVRERELAQQRERTQRPEVKAALAARTKAARDADLERWREYERLQQARRREDPTTRARMRELDKESYDRRRNKILDQKRIDRLIRLEEYRERDRNRDPEKRAASHKAYRQRNKEKLNIKAQEKHQRRKATDPLYRIRKILRDRHNAAIRGNVKVGSAIRDLGCSIEELKLYLDSLFSEGMSWDNYGHDTWHIDHKEPLSSFDLTDPAQVAIAFHYSNLQPLWAPENYQKGSKPQLNRVHAGFTPSYPLPSLSELGGESELPVL